MKKLRVFEILERSDRPSKWLPKFRTMKNINVISRKFREDMSKRNVNLAIKLLSNNMKVGVLPLNKKTTVTYYK